MTVNEKKREKTRRFFRKALKELLSEKPYLEITVNELSERAELSRATFYIYYSDIDGYFRRRMKEMLQEDFLSSVKESGYIIDKKLIYAIKFIISGSLEVICESLKNKDIEFEEFAEFIGIAAMIDPALLKKDKP